MPEVIEPSLVEAFRALVEERTGLSFVVGRADDLPELLRQRSAANGCQAAAYVARFERGEARAELRELAPLLTVGETFFFRHSAQIDAFRALAQQHLSRPETCNQPLRVLSAGCASGEEAYTLAITLRELTGSQPNAVIVGVDLNPKVIERARRARYSDWSLRSVTDEVRARWFRRSGNEVLLDPSIHAAVSFVEGNLVQPDRELFAAGRWDVIFCRNVLMYFSPEKARLALASLTRALSDTGYLFLGHAETLRGLSQDYHLCHTHDAFYYQRKAAGDSARPVEFEASLHTHRTPLSQPGANPANEWQSGDASDWFADIDRAAERVRGLGAARSSGAARGSSGTAKDWSPVLELMQSDRHTEALALFSTTAATEDADADQLLVEATLLTHANRFPAAEAVCNRLLTLDELNAGAHYVIALCREAAGDLERALYHDQVAAYLDPAFAMPHVHMGLLLRRSGRREAARLELTQAHALLEREDTARLAMFGGGFGRSALRALCVAEPTPSGGSV